MTDSARTVNVLGQAEVNTALSKVKNFDVNAAEQATAQALLPDVASRTRSETGMLQMSWQANAGQFVNTMSYAVAQEFGTLYVEPTNAIAGAWEALPEKATDAFGKEIDNAAKQAGFDT